MLTGDGRRTTDDTRRRTNTGHNSSPWVEQDTVLKNAFSYLNKQTQYLHIFLDTRNGAQVQDHAHAVKVIHQLRNRSGENNCKQGWGFKPWFKPTQKLSHEAVDHYWCSFHYIFTEKTPIYSSDVKLLMTIL